MLSHNVADWLFASRHPVPACQDRYPRTDESDHGSDGSNLDSA